MEKKELNKMIELAQKTLDNKQMQDIVAIDLHGISPITDAFLIASGKNKNQLRAAANELAKVMEENSYKLSSQEGNESSDWILLDFYYLIVHLFNEESREFYRLDKLWGDGEKLEFES